VTETAWGDHLKSDPATAAIVAELRALDRK
jgi:hypothetical protein